MLRLYTPSEFMSVFSFPQLVVEDNGLIFPGSEANAFLRNACGKVDWDRGYIYGPDFTAWNATPIAKFKKQDDGTWLITEPVGWERPLYVFDGERFYEPWGFQRIGGYAQGDLPSALQAKAAPPEPTPAPQTAQSSGWLSAWTDVPDQPISAGPEHASGGYIAFGVMAVLSIPIFYHWITTQDSDILFALLPALVGGVAAFFAAHEFSTALAVNVITAAVLCYVATLIDAWRIYGGISLGFLVNVFFGILLCPAVTILPSLLCTALGRGIHRLLGHGDK